MSILETLAGVPIKAGNSPISVNPTVVGNPSTLAGLSSWWNADAMTPSASLASLPDKIGPRALTCSTSQAAWWPNTAGSSFTLGGVGFDDPKPGGYFIYQYAPTFHPFLSPDFYLSATSVPFGSGGAFTFDLVWTRPNLRQAVVNQNNNPFMSASFQGGTSPLLTIAGTVALGMTNKGTGDNLVLFPNAASPTVLMSTLELRHTHSVRLRGSHTGGWDVFLDGVKLTSSPVASQLPSAPSTATIQVLGTGTNASAQCYFHEAFCYPRALSDAECAVLEPYLARWGRGQRQGAIMMGVGQSNMVNTTQGSNSFRDLCRGVEYVTGLVSFTILCGQGSGSDTIRGAHGMLGTDNTNYLYGHITDTPASIPLGTTGPGVNMQTLIQSLVPALQADVCGLWAIYSENDLAYNYTQAPLLAGVYSHFDDLVRAMPQSGGTRTAANWGILWAASFPNGAGNGETVAMHKRAISIMAADATRNTAFWILDTAACNPNPINGGTYDPATGYFAGGDYNHIDPVGDWQPMTVLGVGSTAKMLLSIGRGSKTLPATIPTKGPTISAVTYEAGTVSGNAATPTVLVTVLHDGGNDLRLPLLAPQGLGWVLLDGGNPASSPVIGGTACVRVDATHLRITFTSGPTSALANVWLYYIREDAPAPFIPNSYGNNHGRLGRGCAVTDNYSDTVARPATSGFDIGTDLGSRYRADRPLGSTVIGIPLE